MKSITYNRNSLKAHQLTKMSHLISRHKNHSNLIRNKHPKNISQSLMNQSMQKNSNNRYHMTENSEQKSKSNGNGDLDLNISCIAPKKSYRYQNTHKSNNDFLRTRTRNQSPYIRKLNNSLSRNKKVNQSQTSNSNNSNFREYSLQKNGSKIIEVQSSRINNSSCNSNNINIQNRDTNRNQKQQKVNKKQWRSQPRRRTQTQPQKQKTKNKIQLKIHEQIKKQRIRTSQQHQPYAPKLSEMIKQKIKEKKNKQGLTPSIKQLQSAQKDQICVEILQKLLVNYQKQNKLCILQKIYRHYGNVYEIYTAIKLRTQKKIIKKHLDVIIKAVRNYILEEDGDSADLQLIYLSSKSSKQPKQELSYRSTNTNIQNAHPIIRKILFLQKMCVIMLVDALINGKFNILQTHFNKIFQHILQFYSLIYSDFLKVKQQNHILQQKLNPSTLQAYLSKEQLLFLETGVNKKYPAFQYYEQNMLANKKHCYKFQKNLEQFHHNHYKSCSQFPINFIYYKLLQYYSVQLLGRDWSDYGIQFLQTCPSPYLHFPNCKRLTLLLDLDQTLVHFKTNSPQYNHGSQYGKFLIRPHLYEFLSILSNYYEIGIFTCGMPDYADIILDRLKHIDFRLYRQHTIRINGQYAKDLSRVGRQISTMLIVDNIERNFRLQKRNGITIKSWYGDRNDNKLMQVAQQLVQVAKNAYKDNDQIKDLREMQFNRYFI